MRHRLVWWSVIFKALSFAETTAHVNDIWILTVGVIITTTTTTTQKDRNNRRNPCPSANLSPKNLTWTGIESNPDLRDDSSATNTLSYGKVRQVVKMLRRNFLPPSLRLVLKMEEEVLSSHLVLTWKTIWWKDNVDHGPPNRGPPGGPRKHL
jgi:hypothetical protein